MLFNTVKNIKDYNLISFVFQHQKNVHKGVKEYTRLWKNLKKQLKN